MFDYLVDNVVGTMRVTAKYKDPKQPGHPRSDLMQNIGESTQPPGYNAGDRERYNAFVEAVLQELAWCTRHTLWELYYRPDMSVGCRNCDGSRTSMAGENVHSDHVFREGTPSEQGRRFGWPRSRKEG